MFIVALFFYLFALMVVLSGAMVVLARNPGACGVVFDSVVFQFGRAIHFARGGIFGDAVGWWFMWGRLRCCFYSWS